MFITPLVLLILTSVQNAMADYNPDISNGTCYYFDGTEADSRYIPCGNAALGFKSCCESLDMCLSSHACYNGQFGVTYLAGCTDQSYDDSACPRKPGELEDRQWTGLVYCNGTSNQWVACTDVGDTVTTPSPCWCPDDDSRTVAFSDSSVLKNIMSLPATMGHSITWQDADSSSSDLSLALALGFSSDMGTTSSSISSTTSTSTSLSPASTSHTLSSTIPPSPTSFQTFAAPAATSAAVVSSGLSTGSKIGIVLGSIGGAAAIALLAWLIYKCMQRRSQKNQKTAQTPPMREPTLPQVERRPTDPEMRSPAWSGHKSELPADESFTSASPAPGYQEFQRTQSMEVEGSPVRMSPARPTQDGGLRVPGRKATYYEMPG